METGAGSGGLYPCRKARAPRAPSPIKIATQTFPAKGANDSATKLHDVNIGSAGIIAITPNIAFNAADADDFFIRVTLGGGAKFRGTFGGLIEGRLGDLAAGGAGESMAVFRAAERAVGTTVQLTLATNIGLPDKKVRDYTASMTLHQSLIDARDGVGAVSGIGAEDAVFLKAVSGVASSITSKTLTADVETGFLWFVNPLGASPANTSWANLGTVQAQPDTVGDALDASDGGGLVTSDVISAIGVTIKVEGDFSVGAFQLAAFTDTNQDDSITGDDSAACAPGLQGTKSAPGEGNLKPTKAAPTTATLSGQAAGIYQFCVEVDTAGPQSNTKPIPASEYTATVYVRATDEPRDDTEENSAKIGEIVRNGATAKVSYLTTSEKHNQRLIIVNRRSRPIVMTDISFQTEDGTEADLSDAAKAAAAIPGAGTIAPGDSVTYRVSDMLSITGNSRRAAASMSFNGSAANVSVATTQVNLEDSSTDTVMWPVQ